MSQSPTSRRHVSPTNPPAYEAPETPTTVDPFPNNFQGGPYDTSLLPLYVELAAMHVGKGDVHLFTFTSYLIRTN